MNAKRSLIRLPNSIEELKEVQNVLNEEKKQLTHYNWFVPRNQYFKPHTANAKKFLNNTEFINRQLFMMLMRDELAHFLGLSTMNSWNYLDTIQNPVKIQLKAFFWSNQTR